MYRRPTTQDEEMGWAKSCAKQGSEETYRESLKISRNVRVCAVMLEGKFRHMLIFHKELRKDVRFHFFYRRYILPIL